MFIPWLLLRLGLQGMGCLAEVFSCYSLSHNSSNTWFLASWKYVSLQLRQTSIMQVIEKSALCSPAVLKICMVLFPGAQSDLYQIYSFWTTTEWNKCFSAKYAHLRLSLHSLLCKQQLICSSITLLWLSH